MATAPCFFNSPKPPPPQKKTKKKKLDNWIQWGTLKDKLECIKWVWLQGISKHLQRGSLRVTAILLMFYIILWNNIMLWQAFGWRKIIQLKYRHCLWRHFRMETAHVIVKALLCYLSCIWRAFEWWVSFTTSTFSATQDLF